MHNIFPSSKTSESSLTPSLPDFSTSDYKVLRILPPLYLYHPYFPFLSLPPIVWILISFKRFLEGILWLQSIPASSRSHLRFHNYSCHLTQKASTTLHSLWNDDWHWRSRSLQPVLCSSQTGLLTILQTEALSSPNTLLMFMPLPLPGMPWPSSLLLPSQ